MGPGPAAGFTATSTARGRWSRALLLVAALAGMVAFAPLPAVTTMPALAAATDITGQILANQNVTLDGDSVITLPGGTSTYTGVIGGAGTLTVAGTGTLVLTKDSDFTIPPARHTEQVTNGGGNWPYATITTPDPPAITVNRGAALQYGTGGGTGVIGHFPYHAPGFALNALNIRVDGTLTVNVTRRVHLGIMSGSGFIVQPRSTWPGLDLAGAWPGRFRRSYSCVSSVCPDGGPNGLEEMVTRFPAPRLPDQELRCTPNLISRAPKSLRIAWSDTARRCRQPMAVERSTRHCQITIRQHRTHRSRTRPAPATMFC